MLRLIHLLFFILITSFAIGQKVTPLKGSKYIGISEMVFDSDDNRILIGRYKGTGDYLGLAYSEKMSDYVAKLDQDNKLIWAKPIPSKRQRYDLTLANNKIYVLARTLESDYDKGIKIAIAYLEEYDPSNGALISDNQIAKLEGKGAFIDGEFMTDGVLLWSKWTGEEASTLNSQTLSKKKYSGVILEKYLLNGTKSWAYQIEGGFNGFTDIRIGDVAFDETGNSYIISYFSESAELGISSLSTPVHFDDPKLPLYFQGGFMLKLDKDGKALAAKQISKYQLDFEKIICKDGRIFILGYYRGNEAYAKELEGNQTPVEFLGITLPDCPINPGTKQPSENLLIACVDYDLNYQWHQTGRGSGYARARSMCLVNSNLYVAGTSSTDLEIGDSKLSGFSTDGYADAYVLKLSTNGKLSSSKTFHGPGSITSKVYANHADELVAVISFSKEYVEIDGEKIQRFSATACEVIYDFSGSPTSSVQPQPGTSDTALKIGDRVLGNWKGYGKYYLGKIGKIEGDKYFIQYDDGDTEWTSIEFIKKP